MNKIVVATGNSGKLKEIQQTLSGLNATLVSQKSLNIVGPDETGLTFVENAILKARHAANVSGLPAIADDSGLEVDCLDGEPGIYSARYSGDKGGDEANNQKLLHQLASVIHDQPSARFQCVIVLMRHSLDPTPIICQGTWEGYIVAEPKGDNGFGYDPLFFLPDRSCTAAQLSAADKNSLSHRGQALQRLVRHPRMAQLFRESPTR